MKKILLTTASFLTMGLAAVFAQKSKSTDSYLQASFNEHFKNAKDVSWKLTKNYSEATFTIDNKQLTAFYNGDNQAFAVSRNISTDQLPLALLGDLKRNYSKYWITGLFELSIEGHSQYYITVENADGAKTMKADESGQWVTYNPAEKTAL